LYQGGSTLGHGMRSAINLTILILIIFQNFYYYCYYYYYITMPQLYGTAVLLTAHLVIIFVSNLASYFQTNALALMRTVNE